MIPSSHAKKKKKKKKNRTQNTKARKAGGRGVLLCFSIEEKGRGEVD
jgi:hypothetical protein